MIEAVIQVWFWDEKINGQWKILINSMLRRVQAVIKVKEGHISY